MIEHISPERRMVPRWRLSAVTVMAGETLPIRPRRHHAWLSDRSELEARLQAWYRRGLPSRAVELITAALLYRTPEAGKEAALFLMSQEEHDSLPRRLAEQLVGELHRPVEGQIDLRLPIEEPVDRFTVRRLRSELRQNPNNPLGWADLAHAHASLGNLKSATHSMRVALALNSQARMILRSASRLYVHCDEPDRAHDLISRADRTRSDPWLLAAELATAHVAERTSKLTRVAKRMVQDKSLLPFHITELAGALATLELEAGRDRKARQLFRLSLADPTDNSVAQAQWASRRFSEFHCTGRSSQYSARL